MPVLALPGLPGLVALSKGLFYPLGQAGSWISVITSASLALSTSPSQGLPGHTSPSWVDKQRDFNRLHRAARLYNSRNASPS